jgi:NAD(P)-dependent dehydrogenase (short-subunit alcohol dehydrogenase family)
MQAGGVNVDSFAGRTAFVTGGAGGLGFAMVEGFLEAGMKVMLADIEAPALDAALKKLSAYDNRLSGMLVDVSEPDALERAAAETIAKFGNVHIVCNNAGVGRAGPLERILPSDWQWVIDVNLMGTVRGVRAFLPHMKAHGEGGHIVNTSSMSGLTPRALAGPYAATKFAIIGLSEVLADELQGTNIGVSVLCPGNFRTRMPDNGRNRPKRYGGGFRVEDDIENAARNARYLEMARIGKDPKEVVPMVLQAIRENRLYIFTHAERRKDVEARVDRIMAAFDALNWTVVGRA